MRHWASRPALAKDVFRCLHSMMEQDVIKRFGVVVRHQELGYHANAMVVWDIPDEQVARLVTASARLRIRYPVLPPSTPPAGLALQPVLHDPRARS